MSLKTKIVVIIFLFLLLIILIIYKIQQTNNSPKISENTSETTSTTTKDTQLEYTNSEYGFILSLPKSWQGYTLIKTTWDGNLIDSEPTQKISGPRIIIRHPLWTVENPRQDIPVMIFTKDQWNLIEQEKLAVSAAPIVPSELGNNSRYIFALPARYNFSFLVGFEEVEDIIKSQPLKGF